MPTLVCVDAAKEATGAQKSSSGNRWMGRESIQHHFVVRFFQFASADVHVCLMEVAQLDFRELFYWAGLHFEMVVVRLSICWVNIKS